MTLQMICKYVISVTYLFCLISPSVGPLETHDDTQLLKPDILQRVNPENPTALILLKKLNSTSVVIELDVVSSHGDEIQKWVPNIRLNVTYRLMLGDVFKFQQSLMCQSDEKVYVNPSGNHSFVDHCKMKLIGFGADAENDQNLDLFKHCEQQRSFFYPKNAGRNSFIISGLLPRQPYEFNYVVDYLENRTAVPIEGPFRHFICMNIADEPPKYSPLTDLSSFVIREEAQNILDEVGKKNKSIAVELFWRPVPKILAGSDDLGYVLKCNNEEKKTILSTIITDIFQGRIMIQKPDNITYYCGISSKSSYGYSKLFSPIVIPKRTQILDLGRNFQFHVAAIRSNEYMAKWTSIESVLAHKIPNNNSLYGGNYTIYWCSKGGLLDCSNIDGMVKTNKTSTGLILFNDENRAARTFGISYRSPDKRFLSGIIWSKCVASYKSVEQSIYQPLKIVRAAGIIDNHTAISLAWVFAGCESLIALVDKFEIKYCVIKRFDDCSEIWDNTRHTDTIREHHKEQTENCAIVTQNNHLVNDVTLEHLDSSTKYMIMVRCILHDSMSNAWSDPVLAYTFPDPKKLENCWFRLRLFVVLIMLLLLVIATFVSFKSRGWIDYVCHLLFRFKQTKSALSRRIEDMSRQQDNMSELSLKFWVNRFPGQTGASPAHSEDSVNMLCRDKSILRSKSCEPFVDYVRGTQTLDYIPRNLIDRQVEQTTSENTTDDTQDAKFQNSSEADDISVTSHSSFLDTILNEEVDLNNNEG